MFNITGHFRSAEPSNNSIVEFYMFDDLLHRTDGPAWIRTDTRTGVIIAEERWVDGELHSFDGKAAHILRDPNGTLRTAEWYESGRLHREPKEGPAVQNFDHVGTVIDEKYFVRGVEVGSPEQQASSDLLNTFLDRHRRANQSALKS